MQKAAAGFLPVISRLHHYGVSRSEEEQRARATRCWGADWRGPIVAGGGNQCRVVFMSRSNEGSECLCLEKLTGLYSFIKGVEDEQPRGASPH